MRMLTPIAAIIVTLFAISACDDTLQSPTEFDGEPTYLILDGETDSDNDGVPDSEDFWPDSDIREFVDIQGCITSINNIVVQDGATLMDLVNTCLQEASPEKCLRNLARDLRKSGTISKSEWKELMKCIRSI